MKTENFIKQLKQQPRLGGVPRINLAGVTPTATQVPRQDTLAASVAAGQVQPVAAAVTQQVQQLAQQLANH
jgi:hypothetical protein